MDFLLFALAIAVGLQFFKRREQQQRVTLLSQFLAPYQLEQQMERLLDGYLRWLGEDDPDRREQIRGTLGTVEESLAQQFDRFAADVKAMPAPMAQVSKLPLWVPFAQPMLSGRLLFDVRQAFAIHARGIEAVVRNDENRAPKDRAYMLSAELLLMQHTCHWYCRGKAVATARLLTRHQAPHAQVVASVSPQTRNDYLGLIARR
jgi:hypothetical protein